MTNKICRFCSTPLRLDMVDLGSQPAANAYLTKTQIDHGEEKRYPLHARVCESCWLVQVDSPISHDVIFNADYPYFSSYAASWVAHAETYAREMTKRLGLNESSLVIEVASNDGYLLQYFAQSGIPVLGVEPTANTAAVAEARGVPTEVAFFNEATGRALASRGFSANLMVANNVLAHVPEIADFVAGFPLVLKDEGILTFEFPHLLKLIEFAQFDTIYHEHFSYLSLLAVEKVLAANGLRAFDVESLDTHGGSLRLFCAHAKSSFAETRAIRDLRLEERSAALDTPAPYLSFARRAEAIRDEFLDFLDQAERESKRVAAYGAAAKGNTFLNYAGVTAPRIQAVFDANPHKQGRYLPGSHVPILAPAAMSELRPDYLLILPWNLKQEVMGSMGAIRDWGGRFVIAVPHIEITD